VSVHKRGKYWEVRYREGMRQYSKSGFRYKTDAEAYEAQQLSRMRDHTFTSPKDSKIRLRAVYEDWIAHKDVAPRTLVDYRELWSALIEPTWGNIRLDQIRPDGITKWVFTSSQSHSPARVRKAFTVLNQILNFAVLGEKIQSNPIDRAKQVAGKDLLPKVRKTKKHRYLTNEEVFVLSNNAGEYRTMILVMAYTGLRFGEASALQARDIDLLRGRLIVERAWTSLRGKLSEVTPKSGEPREVPLPGFLYEPLTRILESCDSPTSLMFTAHKGGPIYYARWRRDHFDKAVMESGLPRLTPHDLRHTYASLSIQAGVSPKALQTAMGHSDIRLTMDTYAGLFETDKDNHAALLDRAAQTASSSDDCSQNVRTLPLKGRNPWSRLGDLNPGPTHYECVALPLS
jgi:integrase